MMFVHDARTGRRGILRRRIPRRTPQALPLQGCTRRSVSRLSVADRQPLQTDSLDHSQQLCMSRVYSVSICLLLLCMRMLGCVAITCNGHQYYYAGSCPPPPPPPPIDIHGPSCQRTCSIAGVTKTCAELMQFQTCAQLAVIGCTVCTTGSNACCVSSLPLPPAAPDMAYLCENTCCRQQSTAGTCTYSGWDASNGVCRDGGTGSEGSLCLLGTDCMDCGPRMVRAPPPPPLPPESPPQPPPMLCSNTCAYAHSGQCQDGGYTRPYHLRHPLGYYMHNTRQYDSRSNPMRPSFDSDEHLEYSWAISADCEYGTDCADCGPRYMAPPAPPRPDAEPSPPPPPPPSPSPPEPSPPPRPPPPPPCAPPMPPMTPSLPSPPLSGTETAHELPLDLGARAHLASSDIGATSPALVTLLVLIFILLAAVVVLLASLPRKLQRLLFMAAREPLTSSSNHLHSQTTSLLRTNGNRSEAREVELNPLPSGV